MLKQSSTYHFKIDGQTKVVNSSLETYLRCFAGDQPRQWQEWLHWAELRYNTAHHFSLGMSPFKAIYRQEPPKILRYGSPVSPVDDLDKLLTIQDQMLMQLCAHLVHAQTWMKTQADKHHRDVKFKVGDAVYLNLLPYRMQFLAWRPNKKLGLKFFGPYIIMKRIGPVVYKLDLLDERGIVVSLSSLSFPVSCPCPLVLHSTNSIAFSGHDRNWLS